MSASLNHTHDPAVTSWVASANDPAADFPIQNLPFGRFRCNGESDWRIGVAIGDQVLDLQRAGIVQSNDMNQFMALGRAACRAARFALFDGLRIGAAQRGTWQSHLLPQSAAEMGLPCHIGDYTDFYTSLHHAMTVGRQFRPDNPLLPNYKWVPIGYHGRASSIGVSGQAFQRPIGQTRTAEAEKPDFGPSRRLDFELELGTFIAVPNQLGQTVPITEAEERVFGLALFNDWSARDIQAWEYQPLGPFLAKNFASTLSPWIITMDALRPFRSPFTRPQGDPDPLPYLDSPANRAAGAIDIRLEAWLQTEKMRKKGQAGERLMQSNFNDAYWTVAQLVAHHTVNGCNLQSGDLLGSGTMSGPQPGQGGSMLELNEGGKRPLRLANGETRTWLEDGDSVTLRGFCQRDGFRRIGFGECTGTVLRSRVV
ncbi:MAG: fumarylacetoacetase [Betaproteobacteria bacterium]|nr:fumarylacetoacetase [Betaproteobacteria bacterium]